MITYVMKTGKKIFVEAVKNNNYIEGRVGKIMSEGKELGIIGEIHPQVLENWKLENPVIAFEMEVG